MKIINIGILAHVDAGKTTLTESLLYTSGAIAEQGNVDKGTTRTDTMILERQRGITIQTAVTSFYWNDYKINIVDTPGHMDFLTEAYRSLSVLDGAVLVISAKDGVQAQTRILFHALQKMDIPTIIFINKIDQNGIDLQCVYQSIKDKLTSDMIVMQEVSLSPKITMTDISDLDKWDMIISGSDELLERYVAEDSLDIQELQYEKCKRTRCCSLFPVYHGSAKDNLGTEKLIEAIIETFITETDDIQSELCGYVFKVEYTERKKRLSYLRLYHGTLHLRDTLLLSKKEKIKITEMCIPSNGEIVPADHACPGEIVILADDTLKLNDILGNEKLLPHKTRILSKEFTINCLISFVYTQGAEKLLETSLCQMEDEFMLEILSKIPFSLQLLDVINQVLDDDTAYWEKGAMPYSCYDAEELKIIVEKLVACKRYVTAVNIIGHSECEAVINAECIYKLMKLAGTEESIGVETLDDYAVQKIIGWFQQQEDIDLELRSDIEFIYLPMLDEYSEVRPRALNTRLSLEPEYFCSLIELFYKERNGEKREIELNKSLSDRLYEILFQFKVIPGIDWNGNFDAKRFDYWMKTVKTWSRDNDRYEVAMHTVGSGLSYAELDEDKLPQTAIIEELNRVENEELRRGYYLGIINQRGVHWIDPEGKPELELAEDYENKANIAESRGYSRYAGILRGVADEFKREAKSNILEAKNGDDE